MEMSSERIQSIWNQANNIKKYDLAKFLEVTRDIEVIVQCKWDELYSIEKLQLRKIIQDNTGIRVKDENSYTNMRFEFCFSLECNDEGQTEVFNQFKAWLNSKDWNFKSISLNSNIIN